jgi:hypothetical protein
MRTIFILYVATSRGPSALPPRYNKSQPGAPERYARILKNPPYGSILGSVAVYFYYVELSGQLDCQRV